MFTKFCPVCGLEHPVENFQWLAARKSYRYQCRSCYNKQTSDRAKNNPEVRAKRRTRSLINQKARKQATPNWTNKTKIKMIAQICLIKEHITGLKYDLGHKFPIVQDYVCGLNVAGNIRSELASQNRANGNKFNPCRFEFDAKGKITYYELLFNGNWVELPSPSWTDQTPKELCRPYCEL